MKITKLIGEWMDSNTYVCEKDNECLIVDCGAKLEEVKRTVGEKKVVGIFLTHAHFDHALNANLYAEKFGVKITAITSAKEYLIDPEKNYGKTWKIENFKEFSFIKLEKTIEIGNFSVKILKTPGHSKSDLSFLIDNNLFVGDTIIGRGIGRLDLYGGDKKAMLSSLNKISKLDFNTLYSGHGEPLERADVLKVIKTYTRFLQR